jgi:carbamate kinase
LLILTSSDYVTYTDNNGNEVELKNVTVDEANKLIGDGMFNPLTNLPKIEAAVNFVVAGEGRKAIITNLSKAKAGVRENIGTIIS